MRRLRGILLTVAAVSFASAAQAQTYPTRPVRIVTPKALDTTAQGCAATLGQGLSSPENTAKRLHNLDLLCNPFRVFFP